MFPSRTLQVRHRGRVVAAVAAGVLVLGGIGWFLWQTVAYYRDIRNGGTDSVQERRQQASISSLVANAQVTPEDLQRVIPTGLVPELGARTAPVTVVEFVDYQCPYCQRAAPAVRKVIAAYGDRVRFLVRDFPLTSLHPDTMQSANAARCVLAQGQAAYWKFHDRLFVDIAAHTPENLRAWAQAAGANDTAFATCMASRKYQPQIEADIQAGLTAGVQGTPTFFVNGVPFQGALNEKLLMRILDASLQQAEKNRATK